jgi:hypothetical protein
MRTNEPLVEVVGLGAAMDRSAVAEVLLPGM